MRSIITFLLIVLSTSTLCVARVHDVSSSGIEARKNPSLTAIPATHHHHTQDSSSSSTTTVAATTTTTRTVGRPSSKGGEDRGKGKGASIPRFSPKGKGTAPGDDYDDDYIAPSGKGKGKGSAVNDDDDYYVSKGYDGKGGSSSSSKSDKSTKSSKKSKKSKKGSKGSKGRPHPSPTMHPRPTSAPHSSGRPHASSKSQPARPPSPTSPSVPTRPTTPTRPPDNGQTTAVTLPLYAVDYTLSDDRMPSRDEYLELQSVTSDYFEEYMLEAYSASTQATLVRFETQISTSIYRANEPVHVQYESIAFFTEDSIVLPQPRFLYSVLEQSLANDRDYIITLERELPNSNVFTTTTSAVFTDPEDPPPGRTSSDNDQTKNGDTTATNADTVNRDSASSDGTVPVPAIAGAVAGLSVLVAFLVLYRGKRARRQRGRGGMYVKTKHGHHESGTVSGDTYETYAGDTHDDNDEIDTATLSHASHHNDEPVGDHNDHSGREDTEDDDDDAVSRDEEKCVSPCPSVSGGASVSSESSRSTLTQSVASSFWDKITFMSTKSGDGTKNKRKSQTTTSSRQGRRTLDDYDACGRMSRSSTYSNSCIEQFMDDGRSTSGIDSYAKSTASKGRRRNHDMAYAEKPPTPSTADYDYDNGTQIDDDGDNDNNTNYIDDDDNDDDNDEDYPLWKRLQDVERLRNGSRKPKTVDEIEMILSHEAPVEVD